MKPIRIINYGDKPKCYVIPEADYIAQQPDGLSNKTIAKLLIFRFGIAILAGIYLLKDSTKIRPSKRHTRRYFLLLKVPIRQEPYC